MQGRNSENMLPPKKKTNNNETNWWAIKAKVW